MKIIILSIFILLGSFNLKAQRDPEVRANRSVNSLNLRMHLTDQQTEELKRIYVNHYKSVDSLVRAIIKKDPKSNTIPAELSSIAQRVQLTTDQKISSVLNPEQKLAFEKLISNRKMATVSTPQPPR